MQMGLGCVSSPRTWVYINLGSSESSLGQSDHRRGTAAMTSAARSFPGPSQCRSTLQLMYDFSGKATGFVADVMPAAPCHFPVLTWAHNLSALVERGKAQGAQSLEVGVELDTEEPGPGASSVSRGHGPGWMDSPDCLWGSDWPGEVPEHFWVWPGHVMSPMASHICP